MPYLHNPAILAQQRDDFTRNSIDHVLAEPINSSLMLWPVRDLNETVVNWLHLYVCLSEDKGAAK